MRFSKSILMLVLCAATLAACGLKGPLFLPDQTPSAQTPQDQKADAKTEADKTTEGAEKDPHADG